MIQTGHLCLGPRSAQGRKKPPRVQNLHQGVCPDPWPSGASPMFFFQAEAKPKIDICPHLDAEPVGGHMWDAQAGAVPMLTLHFWVFDNPSKMVLLKNFPRRRTFTMGLSLIKTIIKNHVKWNVIFSVYLNNSKSSRFFFLFQKTQRTITCLVTQ